VQPSMTEEDKAECEVNAASSDVTGYRGQRLTTTEDIRLEKVEERTGSKGLVELDGLRNLDVLRNNGKRMEVR
jgi:hypothetical protein